MKKVVSDEQIISALLTTGTARKTAEMCGISERTLYTRMSDDAFKVLYGAIKGDILRQATHIFNEKMLDAVNVIAEIMHDKEASHSDRLKACAMIIDNAGKFADRLDSTESRTANAINPPDTIDFNISGICIDD
jgi:hypothetical protein